MDPDNDTLVELASTYRERAIPMFLKSSAWLPAQAAG